MFRPMAFEMVLKLKIKVGEVAVEKRYYGWVLIDDPHSAEEGGNG